MIKNSLFCIMCLILSCSHAQVRVALQAGYNAAKWNYTITPGNWETSNDAVSGFNAGALAQLNFKNRIGLQGALLFNNTGTKLFHRYRFDMSNRDIKLYSLNLPVVATYNIDVRKMRYGLGGGFYAACMLSGTEKALPRGMRWADLLL
jgi:Outer membrane protein beta-barrel domain